MRKIVASLLMVFVLVGFMSVSYAVEFTDIEADSEVYRLVDGGIIDGFGDDTFRPENPLTRAQAAKIINLIFGFTEESEVGFTDVTGDEWFSTHALIAQKAGYIEGYPDGSFKQGKNITRQEVCKIVVRLIGNSVLDELLQFDGEIKDTVDGWAKDDVMLLLAMGIVELDESGNFYATEPMTRLDFAELMLYFYEDAQEPTEPVSPPATPGEPAASEDEVVASIRNVNNALKSVSFRDDHPAEYKQIVNQISSTFASVLSDASSGTTITPAYVKSTYASQISSVSSVWGGLTEMEQAIFRGILLGKLNTIDINTLYSYFIG